MTDETVHIPCLCGSGRTFSSCCGQDVQIVRKEGMADQMAKEFMEWMGDRECESLEEMQEAMDRFNREMNAAQLDEFCGLSPDQMARILYNPFGPDSPVHFNTDLEKIPENPFLRILFPLLEGLRGEGVKATAKGNLPQKLCREIAEIFFGDGFEGAKKWHAGFRSELEFRKLHVTRIVAGLAGLLRKYKGRYVLTRRGKELVDKGIDGESFLDLLRIFCVRYNWGYTDLFPEYFIIQQSFLYSLFNISRFGGSPRKASFYENRFVEAFPMILEEAAEDSFLPPDRSVRACYNARMFDRFAIFWGFLEKDSERDRFFIRDPVIRKTDFLDEWVDFSDLDQKNPPSHPVTRPPLGNARKKKRKRR